MTHRRDRRASSFFFFISVIFLRGLTFMVVREVGRRRGHVRLLLLLTLLLRQVGVRVVVAQAGSVLVAFSTYCKYSIVLLLETHSRPF